jgi:cytochrome c-type biogenesis protein CcmH
MRSWIRTLLSILVMVVGAALAQTAPQSSPTPSGGISAGGPPTQPLSPAQEVQAQAIGRTIRCPVCQGLPITESPSDLSQQMLRELRAQVRAGQSADRITSYFAARYGDTVLLDPPRRGVNLLLWLGPLAALLLGAWLLLNHLKSRPGTSTPDSAEDDDEPDAYLAQVRAEAAHGRPS